MTLFKITFSDHFFVKGDLLITQTGCRLEVLEDPHKKWYKILLQYITFGLYKAPAEYKVKVLKD